MTPRRSRHAPADERHILHWLVTYDLLRGVLSTKHLAIGTDLHAAIRQAIDECEADGWTVENDGAYGFFSAIEAASEERLECRQPIRLIR
jgi:hypothetical protein